MTAIRHAVHRKGEGRLQQQREAADASRLATARQCATDFGVSPEHVEEDARALLQRADQLCTMNTLTTWRRQHEVTGAFAQR